MTKVVAFKATDSAPEDGEAFPSDIYNDEPAANANLTKNREPDKQPELPELKQPRIEMRELTVSEALGLIEPELSALPGVPLEAFTLIAGALSSFKTTLLLNLLTWKATGIDVLSLDTGGCGVEPGKCVILTYEDTDRRIKAKLQRIWQYCYGQILRQQGRREADDFIAKACANIRRIPLSGQAGCGIVQRIASGQIVRNDALLGEVFAQISAFAPEGALMGLDPLRLAIAGSQNDDDGADIAVHTLNYMAALIENSALLVAAHTTKAFAKEGGGNGYADAAYATSGSALYSQHARSNFLMARMKEDDIRKLFGPSVVTDTSASKQLVAKLTHGRLSHGVELDDRYLLMRDGVLVPVRPTAGMDPKEMLRTLAQPIFNAIDRIKGSGLRVSKMALETDIQLLKALGSVKKIRDSVASLLENKYLEAVGSTTDRNMAVTQAGRQLVSVESCRESPEDEQA